MNDGSLVDQIKLFLPKYLSPERQDQLWTELRSFPNNRPFYSTRVQEPELLQGDGWRGFIAIDFQSGERKIVSGLILSNSCDIDAGNRRPLVPSVTFVPIFRLDRYVEQLAAAGQTEQQRVSVVETVKRQEITSLMYLPSVHDAVPESLALFGDARSQPLDHFLAGERSLLFRLSDFGFYLFLFKLSIHFNRIMEGVER